MKLASMFAAVAILAFAQAASAQDVGAACTRPAAPPAVDGATATMEQMQAGKAAASDFMAASDIYQTCVLADVAARKKAAKQAKSKLDPAVAKAGDAAIAASQADKVSVGAAFNTSVKAFKAAHPS